MPLRPIRIYGDPALRARAQEVAEFDDSLLGLAADMRETMRAYYGVGLAANQVGVLHRVLVVDVPLDEEGEARAAYTLVNPVILERASSQVAEEGCLSIPGIYEDVSRPLRVRVRYRDERGEEAMMTAEGYLARAILHEIDHLDGVLFIDRISKLKRELYVRRRKKQLRREQDEREPAGHADG